MNPRIIAIAALAFPIADIAGEDGAIHLQDARIDREFEDVIRSNELLSTTGGAATVVHMGVRYFISVGVTLTRTDSPTERLRRITVGEAKALREIAEFVGTTAIISESKLSTKTIVATTPDGKIASTAKSLDEEIRIRIASLVKSPNLVGTWLNEDRSLFFYAVGLILTDAKAVEK